MSELRAADSDRERTAERLRTAAAEGRLSAEELEERLEVALAARTHGELEAVVADLPSAEPPPSRRPDPERRAFLMTSLLLVAIWALTGAGYFWPIWPILGWGVFVLPPAGWLGFPVCRRNASSRR
jgi:hypothetical protein